MFVKVGSARLFFDVVGEGLNAATSDIVQRPTLILLHGGPGYDHSTLRPYFDRYSDTHQLIYLDHRGCGRSTGKKETSSNSGHFCCSNATVSFHRDFMRAASGSALAKGNPSRMVTAFRQVPCPLLVMNKAPKLCQTGRLSIVGDGKDLSTT